MDAGSPAVDLVVREYGASGRPVLVVLHGLLGSSRNWHSVARELEEELHVLAVDLRNHGDSPHAAVHHTAAMAADVLRLLDRRGIPSVHLLGHSMGGKVAMRLACEAPERVDVPVIVDVAPRAYPAGSRELAAMERVTLATLRSRRDADRQLAAAIPEPELRQFLLTNLAYDGQGTYSWKVNLSVLREQVDATREAPLRPEHRFERRCWFVIGGRSDFVTADDHALIRRHFPLAQLVTLKNSGHNPHMDARDDLIALLRRAYRPEGRVSPG